MNSKKLIEAFDALDASDWTNLHIGNLNFMSTVAEHFKICEECAHDFDLMEYEEKFLYEISNRMENTEFSDWICENVKRSIINLTPHDLNILKDGEIVKTISSSGIVRVEEIKERVGQLNGIPLFTKKFGTSEGLPEPQENTVFFVSLLVAQTNSQRKDLILSSDLVRDERGRIVGCSSFATL